MNFSDTPEKRDSRYCRPVISACGSEEPFITIESNDQKMKDNSKTNMAARNTAFDSIYLARRIRKQQE